MIINKFKCQNCEKEHEERVYENISEGTADIFTENYFNPIWDKLKENSKNSTLEDFCKELMFVTIYQYHKDRRRIRVPQDSIKRTGEIKNQTTR